MDCEIYQVPAFEDNKVIGLNIVLIIKGKRVREVWEEIPIGPNFEKDVRQFCEEHSLFLQFGEYETDAILETAKQVLDASIEA